MYYQLDALLHYRVSFYKLGMIKLQSNLFDMTYQLKTEDPDLL